jgi:hypothetical protein
MTPGEEKVCCFHGGYKKKKAEIAYWVSYKRGTGILVKTYEV